MKYVIFDENIPEKYEDVSLFELGPALYEGAVVVGKKEAEDLQNFFQLEFLPKYTEDCICPDFKGGDVLYVVKKIWKHGYFAYQFFKTCNLD